MTGPLAHAAGQLYAYHFAIYRDLGPQREMPFLRIVTARGLTRRDAAATLNLAADERAAADPWTL